MKMSSKHFLTNIADNGLWLLGASVKLSLEEPLENGIMFSDSLFFFLFGESCANEKRRILIFHAINFL